MTEPAASPQIARKIERFAPHVRVGLDAYRKALSMRQDWHVAVAAAIDAAITAKEAALTLRLPLPFDCGGFGCGFQPCICPDDTTDEATMLSPVLKGWRAVQGFAVLRLRVDVVGADRVPVRRAGDLVFATRPAGPYAKGWSIQKLPF
ncbi:MAG TPA: hypothetical protein VHX39_19190, partial [Acetobacteraceae bacterium]|nr:hypothetical protein [Acetobacteraceae bacterium]